MKARGEKRISLYLECFLWLFLAGMISLLFFAVSLSAAERQIDIRYSKGNLTQRYNEKYILQLQNFITKHNISSKDLGALDEWVDDNRLIYIQVKKGNEWIYSSDFSMDEIQSDDYDFPAFPADSFYDVRLGDGTVQVFIMGMYSYKSYMFALIADIMVSFLIFFLLAMAGIRKKIVYIKQMSRDIEILEGGNLEYEVHVRGNDEITELAKGLNAMKDSFRDQIQEVEKLTRTNQKMITELSHDLRTPLTAVLLYAEILQNGNYQEEEGRQDYLNKIVRKIQHMKDLSDKMLAYSVQAPEERPVPAEYMPVRSCLYDELSDMCGYLEEQGIKAEAHLRWEEGSIFIYEEYLIRILDNLASNILKYADIRKAVLIWDDYHEDEMCISFENAYDHKKSSRDGYSIGIRSIKIMMQEMGGRCEVARDGERFRICLGFQYKKAP